MRRHARTLDPEGSTLSHSEAVLFVDDGKAERLVNHRFLDKRMRPHDDSYTAVGKPLKQRPALLLRGAAGEDGTLHPRGGKIFLNVGIVLTGKHFRRSHYAGLIAVAHSDEAAEHRHHGLAGANVALQQAVHLAAARQVFAYLFYHTLLRPRKIVRQSVVAGVKRRPYARHAYAPVGPATDVALLEQAELKEEQFFELKPLCCKLQRMRIGREMYILYGILQRAEPAGLEHILRERFAYLGQALVERGLLKLAHYLGGDASGFELLRAGINPREPACGGRVFQRRIDLGVDYVDAVSVRLRLAVKDEGTPWFQTIERPLDTLEKHHLHAPGSIFNDYTQVLDADKVARHHTALYLNIGKVGSDLGDGSDAGAVHIAEGIEMNQLVERRNLQLLLKKQRSLGSHPGQELNARLQFSHSPTKLIIFVCFLRCPCRIIKKVITFVVPLERCSSG